MGAEDFSYVLRAGARRDGLLGACPPGLDPATAPANHSNLVVFDEEPLPAGVALYAWMALQALGADLEHGSHRAGIHSGRSMPATVVRAVSGVDTWPARPRAGGTRARDRLRTAHPRDRRARDGGAAAAGGARRAAARVLAGGPAPARHRDPAARRVALVLVPLSTQSGESLEHSVGESALVERHAELADGMLPWAIGLFVVAVALWLLDRRRASTTAAPLGADRGGRPRGRRRRRHGQQIVRVGHAGAEATWNGVVSTSSTAGGDDDD